jgi:hypothetical protein
MTINLGSILPALAILMILAPIAMAWDGYDHETGQYIEIDDEGELIECNDIEFYDYGDKKYHEGNILSVTSNGGTKVEIYDYRTNKYRMFEFEKSVPTERA